MILVCVATVKLSSGIRWWLVAVGQQAIWTNVDQVIFRHIPSECHNRLILLCVIKHIPFYFIVSPAPRRLKGKYQYRKENLSKYKFYFV